MKIEIFISIILTTCQANLAKSRIDQEWRQFKFYHQRHYQNETEEKYRRTIFANNLETIKSHNEKYKKGLETYSIGITQFTDQTSEEFERVLLNLTTPLVNYSRHARKTNISDSLDWRDWGIVTPVKDQKQCASCWAFAANGALEAHLKLYQNTTAILSEQQLIDCVERSSCARGSTNQAYIYIEENGGLNYENDYPYEAKDNVCRYDSKKPKVKVTGYVRATKEDEEDLKQAVANVGPVAVYLNIGENFRQLKSGVYYNSDGCDKFNLNHAVVVVGYGTENGLDYWLVKNSWNRAWGEDGFGKIARNKDNYCGIATLGFYPTF